jgi:hypothetical protein
MSYRRKLQRGELRDDGAFLSKAESQGVANLHQLWVGATAWTNGFSEWIGSRRLFARDRSHAAVLLLGPDTEYPDIPTRRRNFISRWPVTPFGVRRGPR